MKNFLLLFGSFLLLQLSGIAQESNNLSKNPYADENDYGIFSTGVDTAWVSHYASGLAYSDDRVKVIAVDNDDNIYIAGGFEGSRISDEIIIKYNSDGEEQWIVTDYGIENPAAIAVDESNNVYLTGNDGTTKYSSSGVQQWLVSDGGVDIAVDVDGNVYIISTIDGDFATTKYNLSGIQQWQVSYNGMQDWDDFPVALVLDDSANVYVTGLVGGHGGRPYYWYAGIGTVKYNTSGLLQWAVHYADTSDDYDHIATGIALDELGNIYVAGSAEDSTTTGYDYVTIKYNNSGLEQWAVAYNSSWYDVPSKLVVNSSGHIYVTGNSGTVKYNSSGIEQWAISETGIDMVVDQTGNFYLTEKINDNYALSKYNTAGLLQWTATYNGPGNAEDEPVALELDNGSNVIITGISDGGETQLDIATIKYNSAGTEQWIKRYCETGYSDDYAWAIAIDEAGNAYVTGISVGAGTHQDYATVKYNNNGIEQWVARYNGSGNNSDQGKAIAFDEEGNVYVTGQSFGINYPNSDYATIKYNSSGEEQWVVRYDGGGNDEAWALAIDGIGNTYVTGSSSSGYNTIKYNSNGGEEWVVGYNGTTGEVIKVDEQGNVYVTGGTTTIKYNSSGVVQWAVEFLPASFSGTIDIEVDGVGNVYVTGYSDGGATDLDIATIKYNSSGEEQWVVRYNGPGNHHDYPSALVIDNTGDIIVGGTSFVGAGGDDYTVIKYDTAGTELWVAYYDTLFDWGDWLTALAIDSADNIYVTGWRTTFYPPPPGYDSSNTTVKYNSDGIQQWAIHYKAASVGTRFSPNDIAVSKSGEVYVAGTSHYESGSNFLLSTYTTIKYVEVAVSVDENENIIPDASSLSQNYPNPFNPSTRMRYAIPQLSKVVIKVFDILGNEIETLVNEEKQSGNYEITWYAENLPSGVYFYQLKAGSFVETKKMILLR